MVYTANTGGYEDNGEQQTESGICHQESDGDHRLEFPAVDRNCSATNLPRLAGG